MSLSEGTVYTHDEVAPFAQGLACHNGNCRVMLDDMLPVGLVGRDSALKDIGDCTNNQTHPDTL
jgi:hypothetical protein